MSIKKVYVIETANSPESDPHFLAINGSIVKWVCSDASIKNKTQRKEVALSNATHYATKAAAKKAVTKIFGEKFQYRITAQQIFTE